MIGLMNRNSFNWRSFTTSTPSTTPGTAITPGSGAEGSYAQIASALTNDVYGFMLWINAGNTTGTQRDILVDIGVDPAGGTSYTAVINNLLVSQAAAALNGGVWFYFPFFIKAGSTVGARARSNSTSTVRVAGVFYGLPTHPETCPVGQYSETIGASGNAGTSFTPGNSGAAGAWASLGTTTWPCWWWQLGVGIANTTTTALAYLIDLAYGDGTNQVMIFEKLPILLPGTAEQTTKPLTVDGFKEVPAGATLYVRGSCSGTAVTGFSATAIGIGG